MGHRVVTASLARTRIGMLAAVLLLAACTVEDTTGDRDFDEAADAYVAWFHAHYDRQEYDAIYQAASQELKQNASLADFRAVLATVHQHLGTVQETGRTRRFFLVRENGHRWPGVDFQTGFAGGEGKETFLLDNVAGKPELVRYDIDSADLRRKMAGHPASQ